MVLYPSTNLLLARQLDATPVAYLTLAIGVITHGNHLAVRSETDGVSATRCRRHNIAPVAHIALPVFIPTHGYRSAIRS